MKIWQKIMNYRAWGGRRGLGGLKIFFFNKKTVNKKMPLKNPKTPKADFSQSSLKVKKLSKF